MDSSEPIKNPTRHGALAKVFHWGFLAVFIYALTKQLDEVSELEDRALLVYEMFFAAGFLLLVVLRYLYMRTTLRTALPLETSARVILGAKVGHLAMYASVSLIAITGLLIGGMYSSGIKSGSLLGSVLVLHEVAVNASYLLIGGHVVAAIYHRQQRDGVWNSMVPVWKEKTDDA